MQHYRPILAVVRPLYGSTLVTDFGPKALTVVQQTMAETKLATPGRGDLCWSRTYVNSCVREIKEVFRWGTSVELVPGSVYHALSAVRHIPRGQANVRETQRVVPVNDADLAEVIGAAPATLSTMMKLQLLTGMRPGEVTLMRGCDITLGDDVWRYRPMVHKTERHGVDRVIPLGPQSRELVARFMTTDLNAFLFVPRNAFVERYDAIKPNRHTGKAAYERERRGRKRDAGQARVYKPRYDTRSYHAAVQHLVVSINARRKKDGRTDLMPAWGPNRLRHNAATNIRKKYGLEVARCLLGHTNSKTTLTYAEQDHKAAEAAMQEAG